jgi:SAM-dependent methyltransferase
MNHALPDLHLDLGCGKRPRNPYARDRLCGVDIRPMQSTEGFEYRHANLAIEPIPFESDRFASVSAFDFIEHVPRLMLTADGHGTTFPFVRLMGEIWRVLAPGGLLYAVTPAYPHAEAFQDPTHVNIITERTHEYFCGAKPLARMYGFEGLFELRRLEWVHVQEAYTAQPPAPPPPAAKPPLARSVRDAVRRLRGRAVPPPSHGPYLLWELQAVKAAAADSDVGASSSDVDAAA